MADEGRPSSDVQPLKASAKLIDEDEATMAAEAADAHLMKGDPQGSNFANPAGLPVTPFGIDVVALSNLNAVSGEGMALPLSFAVLHA